MGGALAFEAEKAARAAADAAKLRLAADLAAANAKVPISYLVPI